MDNINQYLTQLALGLSPYIPGEQPKDKKYVKLNTNENPYPPSEKVREAIKGAVDDLRLYPDPDTIALKTTIADYYNRTLLRAGNGDEVNWQMTEKNIFVGNGSDEVLAFAFPAFFLGKKIAFPNITYSFYPVYAKLFQTEILEIPLMEDFSVNTQDYLDLNGAEIQGILLPNPNAPTGRGLSRKEIEQLLRANLDKVVVIDEAYIDFGGETAIELLPKYDNLLITQTLSKSRSLAGLRVGFAFGNENLIEGLNRIKNSFNSYTIDRLAMAGAKAAIEDETYFQRTREQIIKTRERVIAELKNLSFTVIPSQANFIFIRHSTLEAAELFTKLRENGVLVRYFNKHLIDNYLRVSIGTDEEMGILINELKRMIKRDNLGVIG